MNQEFGDKENWLFRGDRLRGEFNACVGNNGGPANFDRYSEGYFAAAKSAAEKVLEDNWNVDLLVYPIVYNYRHAVELGLKHLQEAFKVANQEQKVSKVGHKLTAQWKEVLPYLKGHALLDEDINFVETAIYALHDFDPTGEVFRYPQMRDGTPFLTEVSLINVAIFYEEMEKVSAIFEAWSGYAYNLDTF